RQQSVLQVRTKHFHSLRQDEAALKLARGNAAMDILPAFIVLLATANDELAFLQRDVERIAGNPGRRQRDAQPLRTVALPRDALDIVRRIAVRSLCDAIKHPLDLIEAKKKRTRKRRNPGHGFKVLFKRLCGARVAPRRRAGSFPARPRYGAAE